MTDVTRLRLNRIWTMVNLYGFELTMTGRVLTAAHTPRSYPVQTSSGTVRRNQSHLICQPEQMDEDSHDEEREPMRTIMTRSQTGTIIYPPQRLTY